MLKSQFIMYIPYKSCTLCTSISQRFRFAGIVIVNHNTIPLESHNICEYIFKLFSVSLNLFKKNHGFFHFLLLQQRRCTWNSSSLPGNTSYTIMDHLSSSAKVYAFEWFFKFFLIVQRQECRHVTRTHINIYIPVYRYRIHIELQSVCKNACCSWIISDRFGRPYNILIPRRLSYNCKKT